MLDLPQVELTSISISTNSFKASIPFYFGIFFTFSYVLDAVLLLSYNTQGDSGLLYFSCVLSKQLVEIFWDCPLRDQRLKSKILLLCKFYNCLINSRKSSQATVSNIWRFWSIRHLISVIDWSQGKRHIFSCYNKLYVLLEIILW